MLNYELIVTIETHEKEIAKSIFMHIFKEFL